MRGRARIRGIRIRVKDFLDMPSEGATQEEILADFLDLQPEDLRASIAYAAQYLDHTVLGTDQSMKSLVDAQLPPLLPTSSVSTAFPLPQRGNWEYATPKSARYGISLLSAIGA